MAASNPGTTFGATIVPTAHPSREHLLLSTTDLSTPAPPPLASPLPASDHATGEPKAVSPFSAFYQHPPASFERVPSRAASQAGPLGLSEKDLESGAVTPVTLRPPGGGVGGVDGEDTMWPSRRTLLLERQEAKCRRRENTWAAPLRNRWSRLSTRNRLLIKLALAIFVVGAAVAIAVGISVAVHGGYYSSKGNSEQIGQA